MVHTLAGKGDGGFDVIRLQIWHLIKDLRVTETVAEQVEHVRHTDAHATNAGAAAALLRIDGDSRLK
jgi:hypothetical protein